MKLAKIKGSLTCFSTIYSGTHRKLITCFMVEDNCPVPNEDPTKYHISVPLGPEDDKRKPASPPSTSAPCSECLFPAAGMKREAFSRKLPETGLKRRLPTYATSLVVQETAVLLAMALPPSPGLAIKELLWSLRSKYPSA